MDRWLSIKSSFSKGFGIILLTGITLAPACTSPAPQSDSNGATPTGPIPELIALEQSLSIEEAYRAIPHQRTPFSVEKTYIDDNAAQRLHRFFELTDMAVVERVYSLKTLHSGNRNYYSSANYEAILNEMEALDLPAELNRPKQLVIEAIQEQKTYFEHWYHAENSGFHNHQHSLVQSSHAKLIRAYNEIMTAYPNESHHNKTAFFDHLCALDFI